ncbi:L-idonate 5-dehydrogenase [compost metagenome]
MFECVGIPGLIQQVIQNAAPRSRLIVVGVCMESDRIEPLIGIGKEMNVHFSFGYTGEEFAHTLQALADGKLDGAPMITGRVKLDQVAGAFDDLAQPDEHAKIIITYD